jgi:hypothetical protein
LLLDVPANSASRPRPRPFLFVAMIYPNKSF